METGGELEEGKERKSAKGRVLPPKPTPPPATGSQDEAPKFTMAECALLLAKQAGLAVDGESATLHVMEQLKAAAEAESAKRRKTDGAGNLIPEGEVLEDKRGPQDGEDNKQEE